MVQGRGGVFSKMKDNNIKDGNMFNTIFITTAGGLIQNIDVTDDLDPNVIVIDFDMGGVDPADNSEPVMQINGDQAVLFKYLARRIADGDIEHFEEILRRANETDISE